MPTTLTLRTVAPVTHDTHRYVFDSPSGFDFEPGQAAELMLDQDGWRDEGRPFTFASLPDEDDLEFIIKSYPSHNGLTEKLPRQDPGTKFLMDGPFGAIADHGAGVFLAAGAGVTPFIPILRKRDAEGTLAGCHLIFSNKTEADIILRETWDGMEGLATDYVVTDESADGLHHGMINNAYLTDRIQNFDQPMYLCGPQPFVDAMRDALRALGTPNEQIVTEDGW